MTLRKMLLRGMLWSLAFAAGTGVLAALFDAPDLIARVVGTGAASAIACALMMPISLWIDREKTRPAGLLGMTAVTIEFLLALLVIWEVPRHYFGYSVEEELGLTMVFLGLGMVFFGLELMKEGLDPLRQSEAFTALFAQFVPNTYFGVLGVKSAMSLL